MGNYGDNFLTERRGRETLLNWRFDPEQNSKMGHLVGKDCSFQEKMNLLGIRECWDS